MYSLQDKRAFITGGTAGIGLAVARSYVESGAEVVIAGRRDEGEAIASGIGARFRRLDVSDGQAVSEALAWFAAEVGPLDILVNNAGLAHDELMEEITPESIDETISVDFKGVLHGLLHGPRHMPDGGVIINTSSVASVLASPRQMVYSACKAAVNSMTATAAIELGPRGIRVNAVLPGGVATDMALPEALFITLTTLSREGQVGDMIGLYNFLASDASAYISGQSICIDGGLTAGLSMPLMDKILGGE
jgi:NAD(P)-dependent dehydrogenase (short-subunit alcohol dehydrogenase family)